MMTDPADHLALLRAQRDAAADDATRATFEALISAAENAQFDQAPQPTSQTALGRGATRVPLFPSTTYGAAMASVLALYHTHSAAPHADYGAALRRYLTHLYTQHATLTLHGIDDAPLVLPLSEISISLRLYEPSPNDLRGHEAIRAFINRMRRPAGRDDAEPPDRTRPPAIEWSAALRHMRLTVIGDPGSGKTMLLHTTVVRLCEVLARDNRTHLATLGLADSPHATENPPVPLLMPLRALSTYLAQRTDLDVADREPHLLLDALAAYYAQANLALPSDFFVRLCETGRAIILLDGLDGVIKRADHARISAIIRQCAHHYPDCHYIVTTRVAAYREDAQIGAGFQICTVADLDTDQQQRLVAHWSRSIQRIRSNLSGDALDRATARYRSELWQVVEQQPHIRALMTNPLHVTIVAVLAHAHVTFPEDRASLYQVCIEHVLRSGMSYADLPIEVACEFLAIIAYAMHQRGIVSIRRTELISVIAAHLPQHSDATAIVQAFVADLPPHIGVLGTCEPEYFCFGHRAFQEFLAACAIADTEAHWDDLFVHYQESWWRDVIRLCAGHLGYERCGSFLEQFSAQGQTPSERVAALTLLAETVDEVGRFRGQRALITRIAADARAIVEAPPHIAPATARVACGRVLARVGDPRPGVCSLPPAMVVIPGGTFVIGRSRAEAEQIGKVWESYWLAQGDKERAKRARMSTEDDINDQPLTLASFAIGRYPVTNAQYACFLRDGGYHADKPWWDAAGRRWLARDDMALPNLHPWQRRRNKYQPSWWNDERLGVLCPSYPVVGISWYEATAFCRWLTQHHGYNPEGYTYQLPSEAEWEFAARGPERRTYPWGEEEPDTEYANYGGIYIGTSAVGCFPLGATPEGVMDLSGNVWEWMRNTYRLYPYNPHDGREQPDDPAQSHFVLRGAGWRDRPFSLQTSDRNLFAPATASNFAGFRLVRHLPTTE